MNYWDEQMGQVMGEATSRPFAMVLGRRTYDINGRLLAARLGGGGATTFNDATSRRG